MVSTAVMRIAGVIVFTLAIATSPTSADQTPCIAMTTTRCPKQNLIVKSFVSPSFSDHDANKGDDSSEYEMEVVNQVIITRHSNETVTVTTESPTSRSTDYGIKNGKSVKNYRNDLITRITTPHGIRSDYTKYDGVGYYKLHETKTMWPEAKRICEGEGAHLVVINSKEEEDVIRKMLYGKFIAFVGFRYQQQKGYYETVLGERLHAGYVNFDKTAGPPSADGECGVLWWVKGEVSNFQCSVPLQFVCELPE